jgi:hypothetical protein
MRRIFKRPFLTRPVAISYEREICQHFFCLIKTLFCTGRLGHLNAGSLAFAMDLRYGSQRRTAAGGFIYGKPSSAISGDADIPCCVLLDDPADELFLSAGLSTHRILNHGLANLLRRVMRELKFSQNLLALGVVLRLAN